MIYTIIYIQLYHYSNQKTLLHIFYAKITIPGKWQKSLKEEGSNMPNLIKATIFEFESSWLYGS